MTVKSLKNVKDIIKFKFYHRHSELIVKYNIGLNYDKLVIGLDIEITIHDSCECRTIRIAIKLLVISSLRI